MIDVVLLDAGPLGMISHPRPAIEMISWMAALSSAGVKVTIPEIADYEVRRELLRASKTKSIQRLDQLKAALDYLPITTQAMLMAAKFWAAARKTGRPTSSDESLDADVILAGQAATLAGQSVIVASTNPKHLGRFVVASNWNEIVL